MDKIICSILLLFSLIASENIFGQTGTDQLCTTRSIITKRPVILGEAYIYDTLDADNYWLLSTNDEAFAKILTVFLEKKMLSENTIPESRLFKMKLLTINVEPSRDNNENLNTKFGQFVDNKITNAIKKTKVCFSCINAIDTYGNILCSLNNKDGDLGEYLIGNGLSDYYQEFGKHPWLHSNYLKAKKYAEDNYLGIWSHVHETQEVIANIPNGQPRPNSKQETDDRPNKKYDDKFDIMQ